MFANSRSASVSAEKSNIQSHSRACSSSPSRGSTLGKNGGFTPPSRYLTKQNLALDDYFSGPRDMQKHSKLPFFMRIHGSVLPKMILPLTFVAAWSSAVTCISKFVHQIEVDTVLLTVLGFVVAFGLSFRCSTAYERYSDGRKYWSQLTLTSRNLARIFWLNINERDEPENPELLKKDLLGKITAINLINAFAQALKHRLRFEPAIDHDDLNDLVRHLDGVMASKADQSKLHPKPPSALKAFGEHLGVTFAQSNPRKILKRAEVNLGNLPHEILSHLSAYVDKCINVDKTLSTPCYQSLAVGDVRALADVLTGCERVLNTPLPLAYSISISQITWAYIMVLPFQLIAKLDYVAIPATVLASYIILGLAIIGREIENPFGDDVNDLPMDAYCSEIEADLDILTSMPMAGYQSFIESQQNKPLFRLSDATFAEWETQSVAEIRGALKARVNLPAKDTRLNSGRSTASV